MHNVAYPTRPRGDAGLVGDDRLTALDAAGRHIGSPERSNLDGRDNGPGQSKARSPLPVSEATRLFVFPAVMQRTLLTMPARPPVSHQAPT